MRTAFINKLIELARKDKNIYLLTADLGYSVFEGFAEEFPDRFINVGISEANMIGVAAGLAMKGKIVYVYSIIPFLVMRCCEQIKLDVCYQNLNVKFVGVGGGFSYGVQGTTHHATEDIAIMRVLNNMKVVCPGDPYEASKAVEASAEIDGPMYIRLNRNNEKHIFNHPFPEFKIGKAIKVISGNDISIISTGNMLEQCLNISKKLIENNNVSVNLISMHTVKPIDKIAVDECIRRTKYIFTVEEHNLIGGLGSAVSEMLCENMDRNVIFKKYGIGDGYPQAFGSRDYLRKFYNIDEEYIYSDILKVINKR